MSDERIRLFDSWSSQYDPASGSKGRFPFDGYDRVLDRVAVLAAPAAGMSVLDLGIGTGNLAARLDQPGVHLWGVDFSASMLEQARALLPAARLAQADVTRELAGDFHRRFDRIISAYLFHEIDQPAKLELIGRLVENHLDEDGYIVLGDISFRTARDHDEAAVRWKEEWDPDEWYWAADEALVALKAIGLDARYEQVSSCAGVFVIRKPEARPL